MGNPIGSIVSGVGHIVGNIFGSQLGFLSGKSCDSVCGPTWDFTCYIENFCIQHLLKLLAVSILFYIVLLFLYTLYKLGICHCVSHIICKMVRACFSTFFSAWGHGCHLLCHMICDAKGKRRRRRDIEMADMSIGSVQETDMETSFSYRSGRRRFSSKDHKRNHLRRSLRPKNHKVRVGVDGDSIYATKRKHIKHGDLRVIRTSSFARRGMNHKKSRRM